MLLTKTVILKPMGANFTYYKEKGYDIKYLQEVEIKIEDLSPGSRKKVKVKCDNPNCMEEREIPYNDYLTTTKKHNGKYYCKVCYGSRYSGENHPKYNPSIHNEEGKRVYNTEYRLFMGTVLKRDNYKCVICGSKDNLHVHHLNSYNLDKDNRINPNNGITLCSKCHKNFHSLNGYGNNTKEQFEEWSSINIEDTEIELLEINKVFAYETQMIFDSADAAAEYYQVHKGNIYKCCETNGGTKATNKLHTIKSHHLFWLNQYQNLSKEQIDKAIKIGQRVRIYCVETKQIFASIAEAARSIDGNTFEANRARIKRGQPCIDKNGNIFHFERL